MKAVFAVPVLLAVLFIPLLVLMEGYIVLQMTVFETRFISRNVEMIFEELDDTERYRSALRSLLDPLMRRSRMGISPVFNELIVETAVETVGVAWVQGEIIRLANQYLLLWRAKEAPFDFRIHLSGLRNSFVDRLSRNVLNAVMSGGEEWSDLRRELSEIPPGYDPLPLVKEEIGKELRVIPDSVDLMSALGENAEAKLRTIRTFYLVYSLFLMYFIPLIFLFVFFRLSTIRIGLMLTGGCLLFSGGIFFFILHRLGVSIFPSFLIRLTRRMTEDLTWTGDILRSSLAEIVSKGKAISVVFMVIGLFPVSAGIIVRRKRKDGE